MQKALSEAGIDLSVCGEVTSEPSVGFFDNLARTLNLKDYDALVHAVKSTFYRSPTSSPRCSLFRLSKRITFPLL